MKEQRFLFDLPIRKDTTEIFHSDKFTLDEFVSDVQNSLHPFKDNMYNLIEPYESKYIEEWFEIFLSWHEVEPEIDKDDFK